MANAPVKTKFVHPIRNSTYIYENILFYKKNVIMLSNVYIKFCFLFVMNILNSNNFTWFITSYSKYKYNVFTIQNISYGFGQKKGRSINNILFYNNYDIFFLIVYI